MFLRILIFTVIIIINYVLQSSVFGALAIFGVKPDTAIILIVSYGILRGDVEGAVFGFFAGLAHDVFSGSIIGLYAMLGMLVGFAAGKPFKDFFHDNYLLPFLLVVAATIGYQFMVYFTGFLFRGRIDFWFYARTIILPKTIYTATLAIPLYSLMYVVNSKIERYEKARRGLFEE